MQPAECPPNETLRSYLAGRLAEEQSAALERHLIECELCEQTATNLESDPDTLIEHLRGKPVPQIPDLSSPDQNLNRAKALVDDGNALDRAVLEMQPSSRVGSYEILSRLGRGGMGSVFLARHQQLGKQVAIKLLPALSAHNEEVLARFQREMRAVGKLDHRAIVRATDAGESSGHHYLVMEYIDGIDLSHVARAVGPLPIADAAELVRQAALGLSYAHAQGVVHRDIKPSNLILDSEGKIKILDFGLAQISLWEEGAAELTTVGQLMGTLDYMAPEQAEHGGAVDYRADLYALGATLFRLLAGRPPLAASPNLTPLEKLRLLSEHEPPRIETLRANVPEALGRLVGELLARNPNQRPTSAAHVAERLAEFTSGSNLVGLLSKTRENQQQQTAPELVNVGPRTDPNPIMAPLPAMGQSSGIGRAGLWTAVLLFAFTFLGGILLVLETQKGQLVIESESADVHIKLVSDGKEVDDLRIQHDSKSTRLRGGKYEIVIDAPSDQFTVSNQQFTIQNGQTIVARITPQSRTNAIAAVTSEPKTPVLNEAVFEGKNLDTWLHLLQYENSAGERVKASNAVSQLVTSENSGKILPVVLDVAHRAPNGTIINLLGKISGKDFFNLYVELLDAPDVNPNLLRYVPTSPGNFVNVDQFLAWSDKILKDPQVKTIFANLALSQLDSLVTKPDFRSSVDRDVAKRIVDLLANHPRWVGRDFWLKSYEPSDKRFEMGYWRNEYRNEVLKQVGEVLSDHGADPSLVAQAAMIAATTFYSDSEATLRTIDSATAAIRPRMHAESLGLYGQVDRTHPVPRRFSGLVNPIFRKSDFKVPNPTSDQNSTVPCDPIVVLLNLIIVAGKQDEFKEELTALHKSLPVQQFKESLRPEVVQLYGRISSGENVIANGGSAQSGQEFVQLLSAIGIEPTQRLGRVGSLFFQTGIMIGKSEADLASELFPPIPDPNLIQPGDTLAIYVPGVVPFTPSGIPWITPVLQAGTKPPVMGLPFPVSESGEILLPLVGKIEVQGRSVENVSGLIRDKFVISKILRDTADLIVTVNVSFLLRSGERLEVRQVMGDGTPAAPRARENAPSPATRSGARTGNRRGQSGSGANPSSGSE